MTLPIRKVYHININCSDIDTSRSFYEQHAGITSRFHTFPDPQPGDGFYPPGEEGGAVQWNAHLMWDPRGMEEGPCIDLLEWQRPLYEGRPYRVPHHLGFAWVCFQTPHLEKTHAVLRERGMIVSPDPVPSPFHPGTAADTFLARDPDGTLLQFLDADAYRVHSVAVNCSRLPRSTAFYTECFDYEPEGTPSTVSFPGRLVGLEGTATVKVAPLRWSGSSGQTFRLYLVQWMDPEPVGSPYSRFNNLGIYRQSYWAEDLDAAYRTLQDRDVTCFSPPQTLDIGPEDSSIPEVEFLLFYDPDGICLELETA